MKPNLCTPLTVADGGRYLLAGGQPFFWLGDTAWLLFQKLTLEEARIYLRNRAEKGYTVIQSTFWHPLNASTPGSDTPAQMNLRSPAYWAHCDAIIQMAAEYGLYMALLPCWGSIVKQNLLNAETMTRYIRFLTAHYAKSSNILWLIGGDIRGSDAPELFDLEGRLLKEGTPDKLVGFHPFGRTSSSLWFQEKPWLDFNMFQSGHRRYDQLSLGAWDDNRLDRETYFGEDSWRYVARDLAAMPRKPTVDGEPSYEWIPQGLHDPTQPFWQACDTRRYAYWSVFAGAMGHTYGDNSIMQFYDDLSVPGAYGAKELWQAALHHAGGSQMQFLRQLMESVDYQQGAPADALLKSGQKEGYHRIALFAGPDFLFAYDYLGEPFTLDLSPYRGHGPEGWWMDPATGVCSYFGSLEGQTEWQATPAPRFADGTDLVLVIRCRN